jgi:hypothetical protein
MSILETTKFVVENSEHVKINKVLLKKLGDEISNNFEKKKIIWDNENVHFTNQENPELLAKYILVLSSLNFCFWPGATKNNETFYFEYDFLSSKLKNVINNNSNAFDSLQLINLDKETFKSWFDDYELPNIDERVIFLFLKKRLDLYKKLVKGYTIILMDQLQI